MAIFAMHALSFNTSWIFFSPIFRDKAGRLKEERGKLCITDAEGEDGGSSDEEGDIVVAVDVIGIGGDIELRGGEDMADRD